MRKRLARDPPEDPIDERLGMRSGELEKPQTWPQIIDVRSAETSVRRYSSTHRKRNELSGVQGYVDSEEVPGETGRTSGRNCSIEEITLILGGMWYRDDNLYAFAGRKLKSL